MLEEDLIAFEQLKLSPSAEMVQIVSLATNISTVIIAISEKAESLHKSIPAANLPGFYDTLKQKSQVLELRHNMSETLQVGTGLPSYEYECILSNCISSQDFTEICATWSTSTSLVSPSARHAIDQEADRDFLCSRALSSLELKFEALKKQSDKLNDPDLQRTQRQIVLSFSTAAFSQQDKSEILDLLDEYHKLLGGLSHGISALLSGSTIASARQRLGFAELSKRRSSHAMFRLSLKTFDFLTSKALQRMAKMCENELQRQDA